jgi:hypothetical protein
MKSPKHMYDACVEALYEMATNTNGAQETRLRAIETLGAFLINPDAPAPEPEPAPEPKKARAKKEPA